MDNTTLESLENAVAHHNEWEGQNIMLSVNESPEPGDELLLEIDLAQCIGTSEGRRFKHSTPLQFPNQVRGFVVKT
jgi:hypothetical protein